MSVVRKEHEVKGLPVVRNRGEGVKNCWNKGCFTIIPLKF